ncbi:hypothetical protein P4S68_04585 [Pseudoalteromonas sp. Hal099]
MVPAFLINQHSISNVKEAKDYIARFKFPVYLTVFDQLTTDLETRADKGIIAPKFVFPTCYRFEQKHHSWCAV